MTANFKIYTYPNDNNLCLKLEGDFDGNAAYDLIDTLKKECSVASKVFVHTSALTQIHSDGRDLFHMYLEHLYDQPARLSFTGRFSSQLSPELNKLFFGA